MSDVVENTKITPENLLAKGYLEFSPGSFDSYRRLFQKRYDDQVGRKYSLFVREWHHEAGRISYDAQICAQTDTNGYAWLTFLEDSIELLEARGEKLWQACGSVYYELRHRA